MRAIRNLLVVFGILACEVSLAQKVSFKIITTQSLEILNMNKEDTLDYLKLTPSSAIQNIELSVADISDYFSFNIIGASSVRFLGMIVYIDENTIPLEGAEIRAASFLPNNIGHRYHEDGTFTLTADNSYKFTLRMPLRMYAQNNNAFVENWSTLIVLKGRAQRYSRLRLDYVDFGKENTLFAHYLPIKPSFILDSVVFYLPSGLLENVVIRQTTGQSCFQVKDVLVLDRKKFERSGYGDKYMGEELEIIVDETNSCLGSENVGSVQIIFPKKVSYLKLYILVFSGILLYFINWYIFSRKNLFQNLFLKNS